KRTRVRPNNSSLAEQLHHLLGKFWADAAFFVFEIDEDVLPVGFLLLAYKLGPAFDIDPLIVFTTKPEIAVIGGDLFWRCEIVGVGNAKRDVPGLEQRENFVVEPGFMSKLERRPH